MDRRAFSAAAGGLLAGGGLGWPVLASAQRLPREGKEFRALERRAPVEAPAGRIEVVEFFWYSCPHCNSFEPRLVAWLQKLPADVAFRRVPVAFRDDFVPQQRLYYALEALGKVDELHPKVFHAIHMERKPTHREASILDFAEQHGLDRGRFQELYNSPEITTLARRARQLQDAYAVDGVPSMGVHGRYYTDGEMTGHMDRTLQVTEYLIAESRKLG